LPIEIVCPNCDYVVLRVWGKRIELIRKLANMEYIICPKCGGAFYLDPLDIKPEVRKIE